MSAERIRFQTPDKRLAVRSVHGPDKGRRLGFAIKAPGGSLFLTDRQLQRLAELIHAVDGELRKNAGSQ